MSPDDVSSPASSSCLDDSAASSLGNSILPGTSNNTKKLTSLLLKDAINGQNGGIKLETIENTLQNNNGINMLDINRNGDPSSIINSNTMSIMPSCSDSATAATAALAAVAAASIGSTPAPTWPYGVNAAAAAASSMFNNYYTASM